jgi:hypothetical protein
MSAWIGTQATPSTPAWEQSSEFEFGSERGRDPSLLFKAMQEDSPEPATPELPGHPAAVAAEPAVTATARITTPSPLDGLKKLLLWTDPGVSFLAFFLGLLCLFRGINIAPVRAHPWPRRG